MRARRTDTKHADVLKAIRGMGLPCMSLHAHGKGLEDVLVGLPGDLDTGGAQPRWLLVEVKTPRNKRKEATASQYTKSQQEWYERTQGFPRITVMGPEDAVAQLRKLMSV